MAPGDIALQADDGGTYRIPDPRGELELVVVDRGAPLALGDLRYDPRMQTVRFNLFNRGDRIVTAFVLAAESFAADGSSLGAVTYSLDLLHSARPTAPGVETTGRGDQRLLPGAGVEETWRLGSGAPRTVLSVVGAATAEGPHFGGEALDGVFADRWLEARERARWAAEIADGGSAGPLAADLPGVLHRLTFELDRTLDADPSGVRRELLAEVNRLEGLSSEGAIERLQVLARTLEREAEHLRQNVPAGHRRDRPLAIFQQDGVGGEPGPPPSNDDCECGGDLIDTVTRFQEQDCYGNDPNIPDNQYQVKEYWTIDCYGDNGLLIQSKTLPELLAIGHCRYGFSFHPDVTCPPILVTNVLIDMANERWQWERVWDNYVVEWGIGYANCKKSGKGKLSTTCPCSPPPSPFCENEPNTPVLVDLGNGGFALTGLTDGVWFDLDVDGQPERIAWTAAGADDAWLALDRDGDGAITSGGELFGARTAQPPSAAPNGYLALAVFDRPADGGDGDGWITAGDAIWSELRLWLDEDRDGFSAAGELHTLDELGVVGLDLDYWETRRRDRHGNEYKLLAHVQLRDGGKRRSTDVYLLMED